MAMIPRLMPNRFFDDSLFDDLMFPSMKDDVYSKMKCDIYEVNGVYNLEMDIPGFDKSDVNIEIDDNDYLVITAEKNSEVNEDDSDKNYIHRERSYGKYKRSFYVGGVDKDKIEASFVNGILKVTMPKKEIEKKISHRIEIN